MTAPTIALTGVTYRYGDRAATGNRALDVTDLTLDAGSTAVLGPNGSGKSTLLRLVATVIEARTGAIRIDGLDPLDPSERTAIRRRLGYQTQTGSLPARMRVDAFCDYVGALKEISSERQRRRWTHWVLTRVGLDQVAHDRIRSLSGGMQRRVALAQALIGLPELLVLDEPLSSLDSDQRNNVVAIIGERSAGATVVVATHHADELAGACDRTIVLHSGRVVFSGPPAELAEQARALVWESDEVHPGANCRSIGAGRYRGVGSRPPAGTAPVEPSVQDGYIVAIARAQAADRNDGRAAPANGSE